MGELNRDSIDLALPQCSLPEDEAGWTLYCVDTPTREDVVGNVSSRHVWFIPSSVWSSFLA